MKWSKETQAYMWAHYYSEDGNWMAWDEDRTVKGGGRGTVYNPELKMFVQKDAVKHIWLLQNPRGNKVCRRDKCDRTPWNGKG